MLVTLHRKFDIAAPRLHGGARRQSSRPSAGSSLPRRRREGFLSVGPLRRVFASSSPEARTAFADDEALTYPERMAALGRVVASTRGVLAAQAHVAAHKAARSHTP